LPLRDADAVVSHESALELHSLSDMIPRAVHLSLPHAKRGQRSRPGVRLHTLGRPLTPAEIRTRHGVPTTSPERSIVDSLQAGTRPEQIELAITEALERGSPPHDACARQRLADRIGCAASSSGSSPE
jgi:predicted transcriptional regulator of viral defense system